MPSGAWCFFQPATPRENGCNRADGLTLFQKNCVPTLCKLGRETSYIPNAPAKFAQSDPTFLWYLARSGAKALHSVSGRLVPEKRPDLLIQAFQLWLGWKLVLAGGVSDTTDH